MKKIVLGALVLAVALCLAGCGQSAALDRTININDLSMSVSSKWPEKTSMTDMSTHTQSKGFDCGGEHYTNLYVKYNDKTDETASDLDKQNTKVSTTGEFAEKWIENYASKLVDETVIDGASCTTYRHAWLMHYEDGSKRYISEKTVYMIRGKELYTLSVIGNDKLFDQVLKTVKLSG